MKNYLFTTMLLSFLITSCDLTNNQREIENLDLSKEISMTEDTQMEYLTDNVNDVIAKEEQQKTNPLISNTKKTRTLCSENKPKLTNTKIESKTERIDLTSLQPNTQYFTINPQKEEVITTAAGAKFIIPAYSFDAKDELTISIKEFLDKKDAYANKLTTLTTDGKILKSAGMFDVQAFTDGQSVDLVRGAEIILRMPQEVENGMNVYYGSEDEDGNTVWDLDKNGTIMSPVVMIKKGRLKYKAEDFFVTHYKFSKEAMLDLWGREWKTEASFDKDGTMIGYTKCDNRTDSPENEACHAFFELMRDMDSQSLGGNVQVWGSSSVFTCISRSDYIAKYNKKAVKSALGVATQNFEKRNADGRKYFSLGGIGKINIDKEIPLPPMKPMGDVLVKIENGVEEIKLIYNAQNVIVPAVQKDGYYVFQNIPAQTKVTVVSSYAKGEDIYLADKACEVKKGDNDLALSYRTCPLEQLSSELAQICQ